MKKVLDDLSTRHPAAFVVLLVIGIILLLAFDAAVFSYILAQYFPRLKKILRRRHSVFSKES